MRKALERAAAELNKELARTQGRITKMDTNIDSGLTGATVRIALAVDEGDIRPKCILWANEAGGSGKAALLRAQKKINARLVKLRGEIAGFYTKLITPPLPKRIYATIIVAINEEVPREMEKLSSGERRERLAAVLRLLGNDPKTINLSHLARKFRVSRETLYNDLERLGTER